MTANAHEQVWFPEPEREDSAVGPYGESMCAWLQRSTGANARYLRTYLNKNLPHLPGKAQGDIARDLCDRWPSAFFELVLARTLQHLGARIEVEPVSKDGKRLDIVAHFPDGAVAVEGKSVVINATVGEQIARENPLLAIIDTMLPAEWEVGVRALPVIGQSDSKGPFRTALRQIFDNLPASSGADTIDLYRELPTGTIHLELTPKHLGRSIIPRPGYAYFDNSEKRIRHAVDEKRKRKQTRSSERPVLLAIDANGPSTELAHFDRALFGRSAEHIGRDRRTEGRYYAPDGEFTKRRDGSAPTFAGVIAFAALGMGGGQDPALYRHPRFEGSLPTGLDGLEQRSFDLATNTIVVREARETTVLQRLRPPL